MPCITLGFNWAYDEIGASFSPQNRNHSTRETVLYQDLTNILLVYPISTSKLLVDCDYFLGLTKWQADAQSQAALYWPRHNGRNKSLADSPRSTVNLSHLSQRSDIFGVFSSCLRFGGIGSSVTCNLFRTISSRSALIGLVNTSDLLALDPEGINMMVSTVLERFPLGLLPTVDVRSLSSRQIARNLMEMLRT